MATKRRPHSGRVDPRPGVAVDFRGRLPRLVEASRFDPLCAACTKPSLGVDHDVHRPIGVVLPDLVRAALPVSVAAGKCGVVKQLVYRWLGRGVAEIEAMCVEDRDVPSELESPYVGFAEAMLVAQADAQATVLSGWLSHGRKDWRAFQAYAAEVWPEQFGKSAKVTVEGVGGVPVSLDEIEAVLAAAVARLQSRVDVVEAVGVPRELGPVSGP